MLRLKLRLAAILTSRLRITSIGPLGSHNSCTSENVARCRKLRRRFIESPSAIPRVVSAGCLSLTGSDCAWGVRYGGFGKRSSSQWQAQDLEALESPQLSLLTLWDPRSGSFRQVIVSSGWNICASSMWPQIPTSAHSTFGVFDQIWSVPEDTSCF